MMRAIGLAVAAGMLAGTAQAGDWRLIGGNASSFVGMDRSSVRDVAGHKRFWQVIVGKEPIGGSDYLIQLMEMDCELQRSRSLQITAYKIGGGTVGTINDLDEWSYVIPGSTGQSLFEAACHGVYERDEGSAMESAETFAIIAKTAF